ncbi:MAG: DUF389 domain-containing protein [Ilumatobacteraceae bacterium]
MTTRAWPKQSPDERRRVLETLAVSRHPHWLRRFAIMLTLSVVIAVMGLSTDSAAVVIGAMLVAPLMTPVLGTAACLSMGWVMRAARTAVIVMLASIGSIAVAWLLASFVPDPILTGETLARTSPGVTDLIVALSAGAAGAYATVRTDVSNSLPGVAVAVALVPPLATVGITLEQDRSDLAKGAALLYTTNLVAIVLAGILVFLATGFVPRRRLAHAPRRVLLATVAAVVAIAAIAIPLTGDVSRRRRSPAESVGDRDGRGLARRQPPRADRGLGG